VKPSEGQAIEAAAPPGAWKSLQPGVVLATVTLVIFIFVLLVQNYRAASQLREIFLERVIAEGKYQAAGFDRLLEEMSGDLRNLAESTELAAFCQNRALGMSMEYGLRLSLVPLQARVDQLLSHRSSDGIWLYQRVLLLDERGAPLADAELPDRPSPSRIMLKDHLRPTHRPAQFLAADDGAELRLSLAVEFKGAYAGQVVVWLNPAVLSARLRTEAKTGFDGAFLAFDGRALGLSAPPSASLPASVLAAYPPEPEVLFHVEPKPGGPRQGHYAVLRVPLRMRSLELLAVFNLSSALGGVSPARLLLGLTALGVAILGGAVSLVTLNVRSLVLRARLDETAARGHEVEAKNRELEAEIGERRRIEAALAATERNYREILNATGEAIFLHDTQSGKIIEVNAAMLRMFGYSHDELKGMSLLDLIVSAPGAGDGLSVEQMLAAATSGQPLFEWQARRKNGEIFWVEATLRRSEIGGHSRVLAVVREVSERKAADLERQSLQERLAQAQKMESVGRLAGGVAHDFNNLLTVILGNLDLAAREAGASHPDLNEMLAEIRRAASRAGDLTRQLLAFSRKQVLQVRPLDLNDLVTGFGKMLTRLIGEDIEVQTLLHPGVGLVQADPAQIEQVILNLAVNARDAMPKGGRLTIETGLQIVGPHQSGFPPELTPGTYVVLTISDNGSGMALETQQRVFEPFFTTKAVGKGTGLGLATVYGIVKQHGGHISFESEPGHGTTFRILLPQAAVDALPLANGAASPALGGGTETILLVEDEAAVRALARRMLVTQGYRVLEAGGGEEALRLAEAHRPIHLLLTDVIMPGMSGRQVYEAVLSRQPAIRVLYVSGYTDDVIDQHGVDDRRVHFLQKPFTASQLDEKIRSVLGGASHAASARPRAPRWNLPDTRQGLSGPRD
jgi:PAS domain S-box-containing protein